MPNNRVAVLDPGTNTFHLLIAEPNANHFFTELKHESVGVKLGEGGINEGTIKPEAYQRGMNTLTEFARHIKHYNVERIKVIATSAMRSASNGQQFMDDVLQSIGLQIETINGDREAMYVYNGVKASGCLGLQNSIIVDIGGGSVEFIIGNQSSILYKQSFEIGAARLMAKFHQTDPIPNESITALHQYLDQTLEPVFEAVKMNMVQNLIGSSGAFETFAELEQGKQFDLKQHPNYAFNNNALSSIINDIIKSNHADRAAKKAIVDVRVDMIVVASLLTKYLIDKLKIKEVVMSSYSLKEGVLAELFAEDSV